LISRRSLLIPALVSVAACSRKKGGGFNGYAFVASQESKAIAAVDLTAFAVARQIRLDDAATSVLAHPTKPLAWALSPAAGTLYEIDGAKLEVKRRLWLGGPVTSFLPEPGGECLWVLSGPGKRLLRVRTSDLKVSHEIRLPHEPGEFDLGAWFDERTKGWNGMAVASFPGRKSVSLIDLPTGQVQKPVELNGALGPVRFRNDGKSVLVANQEARQLSVLDAPSGKLVVHLPLSVRPDYFCFHPDGGQLFITGEGRDAVVVVYPYFVPEVAETVLAGSRPGGMAATYNHLFVTNPSAGDVTILNIVRRKVVAVATVGAQPGCVVITPDNQYALVLNQQSGDMAVLRIEGLQPDRRKTAPLFTMIPVGSKPVSAAVARA